MQAPPLQTSPAAQALPHIPQCAASPCVSTQRAAPPTAHAVCPAGHAVMHAPPEQTCPAAQAVPQAPQFARSEASVAQVVPQATCPPGHEVAQRPMAHACPVAQAMPQAPQFAASLCVSTHRAPHTD
jgi:hypothetical protein